MGRLAEPVVADEAPVAARGSAEASAAHGRRLDRVRSLPWVAIVVPFAVVYVVFALAQPFPTTFPDEMLYQHLARSLADGDGVTWRGDPVAFRALLYSVLLAPVWLVTSGLDAYQAAKVESVLLVCAVAVPLWYLARDLLSRGLALGFLAVGMAGTWMAGTASLLSESVALPLATASLTAAVLALRRGSSRLLWWALAWAVLATTARTQLLVLVPALVASVGLDLLWAGPERRARFATFKAPLIALSALLAVGAIAIAVRGVSVLGTYNGVLDYRPALGDVASMTGQQLLALAAVCGFVPLLLVGALSVRPRAWRDARVGPLLAVAVPLTLVLAVQYGFFATGIGLTWPIERYIIYVAPIIVLASIVALTRDGLVDRWTLAGAAALSLVLLLTFDIKARVDQRAIFATAERWRDVASGMSAGVAVTVTSLVVLAILAAAVVAGRRRGRSVSPVALMAVLGVLFAAQTVTYLEWQRDAARALRTLLPADVSWVDHHSRGPVAVLKTDGNTEAFSFVDFFNDRIARVYAAGPLVQGRDVQGAVCAWAIGPAGEVQFDPSCPPDTDELLVDDPFTRLTFAEERASVADPNVGRLVTVGDAPRLRSAVRMPCPRGILNRDPITRRLLPAEVPQACAPQLSAQLWLDAPATLEITVAGAPFVAHAVVNGDRQQPIPPGQTTVVKIPVASGAQQVQLGLDWAQRSALDPEIIGVDLVTSGVRRSLL